MSDNSSNSSSLLHQNRPRSLSPQQPCSQPLVRRSFTLLEQHEPGRVPSMSKRCPPFSTCSSSTSLYVPLPSTSKGPTYLRQKAPTYKSTDTAEPEGILPSSLTRRVSQQCEDILASVDVIREAVPRSKWQPDSETALCTFPSCTTIFPPPTYFSLPLKPRRHHCRLCGLIFCATHSTQRASVINISTNGTRSLAKERVCDVCLPPLSESSSSSPPSRTPSRSRQGSTGSAETIDSDSHSHNLITPHTDSPPMFSSSTRNTSRIITTSPVALAPIESWMDPSGVLSLYPLAVRPSHHSTTQLAPLPAARPLYAPSMEAQRLSKEKERERMTLRQRRLGRERGFWIRDLDDEDEGGDGGRGEVVMIKGGLRTRSEEVAAGFSTF